MLHSSDVIQTVILIVKSMFAPLRDPIFYIRALAVVAVAVLAGCGQKGPLFLPVARPPVPVVAPMQAPVSPTMPMPAMPATPIITTPPAGVPPTPNQ
jgi:predicted small lipoprotein YifL